MSATDNELDLLTREQVAEMLGVNISTVTRILSARRMEVVRLGPHGGIVRIRRGAVLDYIARNTERPSATRRRRTPDRPPDGGPPTGPTSDGAPS